MLIKRLLIATATALLLGACGGQQTTLEPLPTRVSQRDLEATYGLPSEAEVAETQTARAPTLTFTASPITPSATVPTLPPSQTPTNTDVPSPTANQIEGTITRIAELTVIAETATAPTFTNTPTDTPTFTPSATTTPSNTPFPTPELPDNPEANAVLFISDRAGTSDIWVMSVDGEPSRPLYSNAEADEQAFACDPLAERLIFARVDDGRRQLFAITYTGVNFTQLTSSVGENFYPAWSPTGEQFAFVSTRTNDANIWLLGRDEESLRQLTLDPGDEVDPSWSPDGNVLLYAAKRSENYDIYQYNLTDNTETQITFTDNVDERQPVLSPDFRNIAYVAETVRNEPSTATLYLLDDNGFVQELYINPNGRLENPYWVDGNRILVAITAADGSRQVALIRLDRPDEPEILTEIGRDNHWPRYCYVTPGFIENLPERRPTAILQPTIPTNTPTTPTASATITPLATPTLPPPRSPQVFMAIEEPPADWLLSRETWTPAEFALIVPVLPNSRTGFLLDNLINFTWQDGDGTHVATIALEAFRGELATVLIGYTLNDLPGPIFDLVGIEEGFNTAVLRNSVRSEAYSLTEISFTDVNLTLSFLVPPLPPRPQPSAYVPVTDTLPENWLISTERWSGNELSALINISGFDDAVEVAFVGQEVVYQWTNGEGNHVLQVRFEARGGNFIVSPASYTINGTVADPPTDVLYLIREGLLTNSVPAGEFFLSRIEYDIGAFELIFVVPPVE